MAFGMLPWGRKRLTASSEADRPFFELQREINRVFEEFERGFGLLGGDGRSVDAPRVNVAESADEITVSAELPGIDEKDVEVFLSGDRLVIRGEKSEEKEDKKRDYHRVEFSRSAFNRTIPLPAEVDAENVEARFRKGILTVTLPKTEAGRSSARKIRVAKG